MRANIIVCLQAAWFTGCPTAFSLTNGIPPAKPFGHGNEVPAENEVAGLDAYKVAVLVSVAAAILSLCL